MAKSGSTFVTQMSIVVLSLVSNITLAKFGGLSKYGPDIPISVFSIQTKVYTVVCNIVVGIVLGGQPIFGYNYGAGNELYQEFAVKTFRIYLSLTMVTCTVKMSTIFFQSIGRSLHAVIASLIRDILCFTPLALILPPLLEGKNPGTGIYGILYAAPISDMVALVAILCLTVSFFRKIGKQKN